MPSDLLAMLRCFNGAKLFIKSGPLVSIFGVSSVPDMPPLGWAPDWNIDKFTPKWRSAGSGRDEFVIAMMNYGVLVLLDQNGNVKEWETSSCEWSKRILTFQQWMEWLLHEGAVYMSET